MASQIELQETLQTLGKQVETTITKKEWWTVRQGEMQREIDTEELHKMTKATIDLQPSLTLRGTGRERRELAGQQLLNVLLETYLDIKKEQVNEKEDMKRRI